MSELAPLTPPALDHVIRKCLAKDPDDRWQSIHDVADQLRWIGEAGSRAGEAAPILAKRKTKLRLAWTLHLATALVAMATTFGVMQALKEKPRVTRLSILPPEKATFDSSAGAMTLSPDGGRVAFVAQTEGGKRMLWVRSLDGLSAQPLAGTEDPTFPFWSPDSRYIAFFSGGKLRKIDANGGPPQALCDATDPRGGSWGADGTILFTPTTRDPIFRVASAGGLPTQVSWLDEKKGDLSHRFPELLPDGEHFLFLIEGTTRGLIGDDEFSLWVGSLQSKERKQLLVTNASARYAKSGHLLFLRDRTLMAQRFDAGSLKLEGEAVPVAENVMRTNRWEAAFSVSDDGALAYQGGADSEQSQLVLVDRDGKDLRSIGRPADHRTGALSNDGKRVATSIVDPKTQKSDIWVMDIERGTSTRITFDPEDDYAPLWSPDDRYIYFTSGRQGAGDIFRKSSAGTGADEVVFAHPQVNILMSLAADGKLGAMITLNHVARSSWDILLLQLAERKAQPFLQTPFNELSPSLSRDGRWLLYHSNESGRAEVYVQRLDGEGGKWQISTDGGSRPRWGRGDREVYFITSDYKLMIADVQFEPAFSASIPRLWMAPGLRQISGPQADLSRDGSMLLVNRAIDLPTVTPVTLVQNWAAALDN